MRPEITDLAIRLVFRRMHYWRNRRDLSPERRRTEIACQLRVVEMLREEGGTLSQLDLDTVRLQSK